MSKGIGNASKAATIYTGPMLSEDLGAITQAKRAINETVAEGGYGSGTANVADNAEGAADYEALAEAYEGLLTNLKAAAKAVRKAADEARRQAHHYEVEADLDY